AARYVLEHPEEVALRSMRQLAGSAGVRPATMVRLAQRLDYPSFVAFRTPFEDHLRGRTAPFSSRVAALQAQRRSGKAAGLVDEIAQSELRDLRQAFDDLGAELLGASAELLGKAHRLYVVGLRSCYPVAFFFHYACSMFREDPVLLDARGGTFADGLRGIGPRDGVLAISFSPYTRETVNAVRYAAEERARVVALTDSPRSPLTGLADLALLVPAAGPSFFHSLVPALAVAQALVVLMAAAGGERSLASLREREAQLARFNAYWDEVPVRYGQP
ncbi:MAG TPA: MurR/RpiR family transcriptional regulator, partial [Alphaproteobacteria bacterium]|nr:MurR/RpiR family transcriptional regulator [Alphaproteobacteria bacterium]